MNGFTGVKLRASYVDGKKLTFFLFPYKDGVSQPRKQGKMANLNFTSQILFT